MDGALEVDSSHRGKAEKVRGLHRDAWKKNTTKCAGADVSQNTCTVRDGFSARTAVPWPLTCGPEQHSQYFAEKNQLMYLGTAVLEGREAILQHPDSLRQKLKEPQHMCIIGTESDDAGPMILLSRCPKGRGWSG